MVPPEEIEKAQPATLPADFNEWDSGDAPVAEPAKPATARVAVSPVVNRMPSAAPYKPAPAYEDVEKMFQPRQSDGLKAAEEEQEEQEDKSTGKRKGVVTFAALGSVAVLLVLGSWGYSRFRSRTETPKPTVVTLPQATNSPLPPITNLPAAKNAPAPAPVATEADRSTRAQSDLMNNQLTAPSRIPNDLKMLGGKEPPPSSGFTAAGTEGLGSGGVVGNAFNGRNGPRVKVEAPRVMNISAGVAGGLLVQKTAPVYPQIAKEARVSGTVVIQATISKGGLVENLRVVNGPVMLRQSAMDAVKSWRYRPYLLDGQPVEVETTVNVTFTLGG